MGGRLEDGGEERSTCASSTLSTLGLSLTCSRILGKTSTSCLTFPTTSSTLHTLSLSSWTSAPVAASVQGSCSTTSAARWDRPSPRESSLAFFSTLPCSSRTGSSSCLPKLTLVAVLPWIIGSQFWTRMMMAKFKMAHLINAFINIFKFALEDENDVVIRSSFSPIAQYVARALQEIEGY